MPNSCPNGVAPIDTPPIDTQSNCFMLLTLGFSVLFNFAGGVMGLCGLNLLSLMSNELEPLFIYTLAICMSSFITHLVISFAQF